MFACLMSAGSSTTFAQDQGVEDNSSNINSPAVNDTVSSEPFKQARYQGTAILIHLPTNAARALVMPEPVVLQGDPEQMPGVQLAYEGFVVGFFATRDFTRRGVSFVGQDSGTLYQLQIRASENGIVEPLEIIL